MASQLPGQLKFFDVCGTFVPITNIAGITFHGNLVIFQYREPLQQFTSSGKQCGEVNYTLLTCPDLTLKKSIEEFLSDSSSVLHIAIDPAQH